MINRSTAFIDDTHGWRSPVMFLMLIVTANAIGFSTWWALLNNFAVQQAHFTGAEIGMLQSIREIPGLLSFTAIAFLFLFREQTFAILSLLALGLGTALTGFFPSEYGFYATCLLMSIGFHYYETMNQSLSLQWLPKANAPAILGKILAIGSYATIAAYAIIFFTWKWLELDFTIVYMTGGMITVAIALFLWLTFPRFETRVRQRHKLVLRQRYWLYYALTFMAGARRQIFVVFAGFMMVERFGFSVAAITAMFLANSVFNTYLAPKIGSLISTLGERRMLVIEYVGLTCVFIAYALVENPWVAVSLYIIDHAFFAMAIAMKTYFQKIADPADIAPTTGVAFSINHIAAVIIPVLFGLIWLHDPAAVFYIGAAMALVSLGLSLLVPRHPRAGGETILKPPVAGSQAAQ